MAIASLYGTRRGPMASVALLRAKEILQSGGKSLNPEFTTIDDELYHGPRASALNASETREYQRLRAVAEKWNNERQAFMLGRLRAGRHPDTDARFWDGVPALPDLSVHEGLFTFLGAKVFTPTKIMMGLFFLVIASPFLIVAYLVARGYRRRRAQSVH
jgi:hypothetical protein